MTDILFIDLEKVDDSHVLSEFIHVPLLVHKINDTVHVPQLFNHL